VPTEVRQEVADDAPAIRCVHERAFGRRDEADLVEAIRATDGFLAELSLVACDADGLVGHVLVSVVALDSGVEVLALAPLAVVPERQRRGIGTRLVTGVLDRARATRYPIVVVVGDPVYYRRFGFESAAGLGIESPFPVPRDAWMASTLPAHRAAARGRVVYPPAFAGL
jgi:putative acetyltransferase